MVCKSCGKTASDGAQFCGYCGAKIEQPTAKKFCTICGAELKPEEHFCHACGTHVESTRASVSASENSHNTKERGGRLLTELKAVSMYAGEPKMGSAKIKGDLSVYDDRLEFAKQAGNPTATAIGGSFGLIGGIVAGIATGAAQAKVSMDPVTILPLNQIASLRVGKFGAYNTLVVSLRDGSTVTFCPSMRASSEPQTIAALLKHYI